MDWYWLGGVVLGFAAGVGVGVNLLAMVDEVMKKALEGDCGDSLAALTPSSRGRAMTDVQRKEAASVRRQEEASVQQQEKGR